MKVIADFHIHSKYSRATSKRMTIPVIAKWAKIKGIDLVSTSDFTHPAWNKHLKENLDEIGNGFFSYKKTTVKFLLSTEISSIYSRMGKCRKVHNIVVAPDFKTVDKIIIKLSNIGNLYSDGRPILGLDSEELAKIVFDANSKAMVIPAHMWTPWFSVLGAKSGFKRLKDCYGSMNKHIFAGETGLSSDPEHNWRLSMLDDITLISNSDAHSPENLGREANVFELPNNYTYDDVYNALKTKDKSKLLYTIEFYPEEGKYHFEGHRKCGITMHPEESKKHNGICPVCKRPLTPGVYSRINQLADRKEGYKDDKFPDSKHIIPLAEIISQAVGVGKNSKTVQNKYHNIIRQSTNEFDVLLNADIDRLHKITDKKIVDGIQKSRTGNIYIRPGYDGEYGKISVFDKIKIPKNYFIPKNIVQQDKLI